jgi:hypothetical protein
MGEQGFTALRGVRLGKSTEGFYSREEGARAPAPAHPADTHSVSEA